MNNINNWHYELIVNKPSLVSRRSKIGGGLFTLFFWALFVYLWMPFITLIAWTLGFRLSYGELIEPHNLIELKRLAVNYSIVIMILGGALLAWALLQYMRFRNVRRRRDALPVTISELANYARVDERQLLDCQSARRMLAHHNQDGELIKIDHIAAMQTIEQARGLNEVAKKPLASSLL